MARVARRVVIAIVVSSSAACGAIVGLDDLVIGDCKGGVCLPDAEVPPDVVIEEDTGVLLPDDSGVPCPGKEAPTAVRIGSPGNTFCIDATEVTNGQYKAFLDAKIDPKSQPPECRWNTSFAADPTEAGTTHPVVGVDWCDALAYCTWAGKYLCGRVEDGKKAGPVTLETSSDFRSHQWMLACSAEARLRYPYGAIHDPRKCNLADLDAGRALTVGTAPGCVGGYVGLYDLVGNVWEWYDGPCRSDGGLETDGGDGGPQSDNCWIKGGSYLDRGPQFDCRFDGINIRRDRRTTNIGFRCCSD